MIELKLQKQGKKELHSVPSVRAGTTSFRLFGQNSLSWVKISLSLMNKTTSFIFFRLLLRVSRVLARGLGSFSKDLEIKIVGAFFKYLWQKFLEIGKETKKVIKELIKKDDRVLALLWRACRRYVFMDNFLFLFVNHLFIYLGSSS